MARFQDEVRGIKGGWHWGDNLMEFNRLSAQSRSNEETAFRTWTGQQALKFHFSQVEFLKLEGSPGQYTDVEVLFTRP